MLIKCPDCGNDVSDSAMSCPVCGAPVKTIVRKEKIATGVKNSIGNTTRFFYVNFWFGVSLICCCTLIGGFIWLIQVSSRVDQLEWKAKDDLKTRFGGKGEPKENYDKHIMLLNRLNYEYPERWRHWSDERILDAINYIFEQDSGRRHNPDHRFGPSLEQMVKDRDRIMSLAAPPLHESGYDKKTQPTDINITDQQSDLSPSDISPAMLRFLAIYPWEKHLHNFCPIYAFLLLASAIIVPLAGGYSRKHRLKTWRFD